MKLCISEMSAILKQSIREELEGVYSSKQADVQQKYEQRLSEYQGRIAEVEGKMADRERKIVAELTVQFESKINELKAEK